MNINDIVINELKLHDSKDLLLAQNILSANIKDTDSDIVKAIKEQYAENQKDHTKNVAKESVELLKQSAQNRLRCVERIRMLRAEIKAEKEKAKKLYNAEKHLIETGMIAPLALYLDACATRELDNSIKKNLEKNPIKDYWSEDNKSNTKNTEE